MRVLCTSQMGTGTVLGQTMRVVAVAKTLLRRGHQVQFLAGGKIAPVIKEHGLKIIALPSLPEMEFPAGLAFAPDGNRREEVLAGIRKAIQQVAKAEKEAVAKNKPDVILCGNLTGPLTARAAGIPSVLFFLQPHGKKTVESFMQRLFGSKAIKSKILAVVQAADRLVMEGMPELGGDLLIGEIEGEYGVSKSKLRYTGPLLTELPDDLPAQTELKKRHAGNADKPLVYVTIGGGSPLIGEDFLSQVLAMFRELPAVTGVVATGLSLEPERLKRYHPPDNVLIRGFVPGLELIKASDVTIFHGGSSTLMNCLACGRPGVVIPSMAEQEDNGAVLAQNGAGIVLKKEHVTPGLLAQAVKRILSDANYLLNAQKLKQLAKKYGGAEAAANIVEELTGGERQ